MEARRQHQGVTVRDLKLRDARRRWRSTWVTWTNLGSGERPPMPRTRASRRTAKWMIWSCVATCRPRHRRGGRWQRNTGSRTTRRTSARWPPATMSLAAGLFPDAITAERVAVSSALHARWARCVDGPPAALYFLPACLCFTLLCSVTFIQTGEGHLGQPI